jgi:hypothetical protein
MDKDTAPFNNITSAYTLEFTLGYDQALHIDFSNQYQNVTVELKIITKARYDNELIIGTDVDSVSGVNFAYYTRTWGSAPSSSGSISELVIIWTQAITDYEVEFKGNNRQSVPGTYYVLVYGENTDGFNPNNDEVKFDISVAVDGIGRMLQPGMLIAGVVVLGGLGILLFRENIYRNMKGGR